MNGLNKNQKVLFMGGFPRAGSTLLMNVLNENPKFFGTPTSGLVSSIFGVRDGWKGNDVYKSNGEEYIYPKIKTMLKNMMIGFYQKEVLEGKIPIDKNRAWSNQIFFLEEIFGCKIKILFPIRHIGDCALSMERVNRKSTLINHGDNGNFLNEQTTVGRAENFIKDDGVLGQPMMFLRDVIYNNMQDRLVFVPYDDMLTHPKETFSRVYSELGMEEYNHDFENIKQTIYEQDMHHGFKMGSLHSITEGKLGSIKPRDYSILKKEYIDNLENERYGDITNYINQISLVKKG
jgi:sulfotransferase